ncbi:MAG: hypothetical protein EBS82_02035 [Methylocystaceae bacterium]|nr:hypothetical protein [Methylocystaceae bacterium]
MLGHSIACDHARLNFIATLYYREKFDHKTGPGWFRAQSNKLRIYKYKRNKNAYRRHIQRIAIKKLSNASKLLKETLTPNQGRYY